MLSLLKTSSILVSVLIAASAWSQDVAVVTPTSAESVLAPPVVSTHPVVRQRLAGHEALLLKYRSTDNLPVITNEKLLGAPVNEQALANTKAIELLGTLPRVTVLPCDNGCIGNDDYNKAVKNFLANYDQAVRSGHFSYRGNMTVKVRWFKERGFFEKQLPTFGRDVFAISFPLEGKLLTLSFRDSGKNADMKDLTIKASGVLAVMLTTQMGVGIKPFPLQELLPQAERSWWQHANNAAAPVASFIDSLLGREDLRSRIEPMNDAYASLLPAVDGILPNEVDPMNAPVFFNTF